MSFVTASNHKIQIESQKNRTSLARRGQSLQPRELVRRLSDGGQIPTGNIYDHYIEGDFSEHDYDDTASIARIDPLEFIDRSREMLGKYEKYVQDNEKKNDKKVDKEVSSLADELSPVQNE